jgi:signal transduction histidine kinase
MVGMTTRHLGLARPAAAAVVLSAVAAVQAVGGHVGGTSRVPTTGFAPVPERPQDLAVAVMLALAMTAPVALVGLWPVVAASLSGLATLLCVMSATPPTVGGVVAVTGLYFVVGRTRPWWTVGILVAPFVLWSAVPVADVPGGRGAGTAVALLLAAAGTLGVVLHARESTSHRTALVVAAQESNVEYVARGERARIARELHDVVAHHVSLIALQADAARLTTPGLPGEAAQKLVDIGDTARTALAEMRGLLGVLREDTGVEHEPFREPQPDLQQVPRLLDDIRELGPGGARLVVTGCVGPLDPSIELTAYRIVQEALTNARRHAVGAAVEVELRYGTDALVVRVRDTGPGPSPDEPPGGHGLAGMKERITMVGGELETGAGPFGGFVVTAVLPARVRS